MTKKKFQKKFKKFEKGAGSAIKIARSAMKIASTVASLINVEFKRVDTSSSFTPGTTGQLLHLSPIAQGDSVLNRDGNQVKIKSVEIRAFFQLHSDADFDAIRFIPLIDLRSDSTSITVADVLASSGVSVNTLSFRNLDNRTRFVVLKDFPPITMTQKSTTAVYKHWYKKLDLKSIWDGGASTDVQAKQLYLLILCKENDHKSTIDVRTRVRFIDN